MGSISFMGRSVRLEVVLACFLFLIFYIIVQKVKISRLKNQLSEANVKQSYLEEAVSLFSKQSRENQEYKEISEQTKARILQCPSKYYDVKNTVFGSKEEMRFFQYLYDYLNRSSSSSRKYVLLPQVSLHAYIQPKAYLNYDQKNAALRLIGGKNTDFLICKIDISSDEIFKPVVAVEINGEMHDKNRKTVENDEIKKAIFDGLEIPFVSHILGSGKYIQSEVEPYINPYDWEPPVHWTESRGEKR